MYRDIPEGLRILIEPVVEDAGLELVDVTITRGRPPWLLRITIDTREADGRVSVDRCAEVSREIEVHLDAAEAIANAYRLEVSSPGLDRILAREKDFSAACGSEVRIETRRPLVVDPVVRWGTFLGGTSDDNSVVVLNTTGDTVTIMGRSRSLDFPTSAGAYRTGFGGGTWDGFVAKMMYFWLLHYKSHCNW